MNWGKIWNIIVFIVIISIVFLALVLPRFTKYHSPFTTPQSQEAINNQFKKIKKKAILLKNYAAENNYSLTYGFIIDMSQHSGYKRFYVYHFGLDTIINSGLVAHGSCNTSYLTNAYFNNKVGCGCSANGMYKVDYPYIGNYGKAFKLVGLEKTNDNAFERNIVLHSYDCVPNEETYPQPICNSLGCPMVSSYFLRVLQVYINKSNKPILLWILDEMPNE